jgi:hypothetical protein
VLKTGVHKCSENLGATPEVFPLLFNGLCSQKLSFANFFAVTKSVRAELSDYVRFHRFGRKGNENCALW